MVSVKGVLKELWWFKSTIIMIGAPILLAMMLPFYEELGLTQKACNCLFMMLLMAVYWITETFHLAVTALIPLVLSPLLSIQTSGEIAKSYLKDLNILFMGGLMVAVVIEHSQLHRRIALSILKRVGTNIRFLMLGFMLPTWFLSMWISNSATAAMMVTIALAVISQLQDSERALRNQSTDHDSENSTAKVNDDNISLKGSMIRGDGNGLNVVEDLSASDGGMVVDVDEDGFARKRTEHDTGKVDKWDELGKALLICVAYSASIGGIATITGTAPNLIFKENLDRIGAESLGGHDFGVDFASWLGFGLPLSLVMLILCWIVVQLVFVGFRCKTQTDEERKQIKYVIDKAYDELGPIKFREVVALIHFSMLALLWISRNPGGSGGWGSLFTKGYVSDGTAAIFVVVSMFMWPAEMPDLFCMRGGCGKQKAKAREPFITWQELTPKVQWGLIFLIGGGFALADSIKASGLSQYIGESLNFIGGWPRWSVVLALSTITALLTEITSNTAITSIFLPITARIAVDLEMNPIYFMLPVCISASYAFMLPVATGPNALVYASGKLTLKDMVKAGWIMNLLGIGVATLATLTWSTIIFKADNITYSLLRNTTVANGTLIENSTLVNGYF